MSISSILYWHPVLPVTIGAEIRVNKDHTTFICSLIHFDSHSYLRRKRRVPPENVFLILLIAQFLNPTQKFAPEFFFQVSICIYIGSSISN